MASSEKSSILGYLSMSLEPGRLEPFAHLLVMRLRGCIPAFVGAQHVEHTSEVVEVGDNNQVVDLGGGPRGQSWGLGTCRYTYIFGSVTVRR